MRGYLIQGDCETVHAGSQLPGPAHIAIGYDYAIHAMAVEMTGVRPNTNIAYRYASNSGSQDVMLVGGLAAASHAILMNSSAKDMEPTVGPENAPA